MLLAPTYIDSGRLYIETDRRTIMELNSNSKIVKDNITEVMISTREHSGNPSVTKDMARSTAKVFPQSKTIKISIKLIIKDHFPNMKGMNDCMHFICENKKQHAIDAKIHKEGLVSHK